MWIFVICHCSDGAKVLHSQRPRTKLYSLVCWVHRPFHVFPHSGGSSDIWICTGTEPRLNLKKEIVEDRWINDVQTTFSLFIPPLSSMQVIQVFTVNPLNIALLNHSVLPLNLTNYYTELLYQQDSNFNPLLWVWTYKMWFTTDPSHVVTNAYMNDTKLFGWKPTLLSLCRLPLLCRCVVPGPAFSQLTAEESVIVLHNLTTLCTDLDPQVINTHKNTYIGSTVQTCFLFTNRWVTT